MFHTKKKQVILVRHAKALELSEFDGLDFDRPLTEKGEGSIRIVVRYLRLIGVRPDRIIASPAIRTRDTAKIIATQFSEMPVEYVTDLYNGGSAGKRDANDIHLRVVQKMRKDANVIMIVGHNDDLTEFAEYLSGDTVPSMKKWSIVVLSVPDNVDWKDISKNSLSFVYYLTPHFLRLEELV